MSEIDALVERSGELKQEVLRFATQPRFDRVFREALSRRFGTETLPQDQDESAMVSFFDWYLQQYRLHDGRTFAERFADTHPELPQGEREFLRGWRDGREGIFEIVGRDGDVLLAEEVIDDLSYRIHSNPGLRVLDRLPVGSFMISRVVPVNDEWLISGIAGGYAPRERDNVLASAARLAAEHPELAYRNPDRLQQGWQVQRQQREAFIGHFGADQVTVAFAEFPEAMRGFWAALGGDGDQRLGEEAGSWGDARTVGIIYDETFGLAVVKDYALAEEAFADPDLLDTSPPHREVVKSYLTHDSVDPAPIQRLAARNPENASRVIKAALAKPALDWDRDGEKILRRLKKKHYDRSHLPAVGVLSERLGPYLRAGGG